MFILRSEIEIRLGEDEEFYFCYFVLYKALQCKSRKRDERENETRKKSLKFSSPFDFIFGGSHD